MKSLLFLLLTLVLAFPASAGMMIKVATWNIEHLRAAQGQGKNPRYAEDYLRLKQYATLLNADIFALQEIENEQALAKIFDPKLYQFFVSERKGKQRTAFVVRRTLLVQRYPDLDGLNTTGALRHGVDIEIETNQHRIRLLAVHLKSGCFEDSLPDPSTKGNHCEKLATQIPVLEGWIDARATDHTPLIVMGDFNRRFDAPGDEFWPKIDDGDPVELDLFRATEGKYSECWYGEYPRYIDHIIYGRRVSEWVVSGSFEQLVYAESKSMAKLLSDHCPIAVTLDVPRNDSP